MKMIQSRVRWIALLLGLALIGGTGFLPGSFVLADAETPTLISISPDQVANDVDTPVVITGSGFSQEGGDPQIYLGSTPLNDVEWVDETTLNAVIPWGLNPDTYSLLVVNPDGGQASLENAVVVTQGIDQWNSQAIDGGPVETLIAVPNAPAPPPPPPPPFQPEPCLMYAHSETTWAIYKSVDCGEEWTTVGHEGGQYLSVDSFDSDTLYINARRSLDGGVTWQDLLPDNVWPGTDGAQPGYNSHLFADPYHEGVLYLAGAKIPTNSDETAGLLRSTDGGASWTVFEDGFPAGDTNITALEFAMQGTLYAGTRDGNLYYRGEADNAWQQVGSASILDSIGLLKINPYTPSELWATTADSMSAEAHIVKVDLDHLSTPPTPVAGWATDNYPRTLGFVDADTAYIGTLWDNGWITEDGGANWSRLAPNSGKPGNALVLSPWDDTKSTFYITDERYGVQVTHDGGATWSVSNHGLHAMSPDRLAVDPTTPGRIYAKIAKNGWPGIFISGDGGQNWDFSALEPSDSPVTPLTSTLAVNSERVFVGAHGNETYGMGPNLYISTDQGATWSMVLVDPTPAHPSYFYMPWALKTDPSQPQTLLMTAVIGSRSMTTDQFISEIYRSTDNGDHWQRINLASPEQVGHEVNNLSSLAFDPSDPDVVYAAADHEILKSTDNGLHWVSLIQDPEQQLAGDIAVEPVAPHRVYVGRQVSLDGGQTWNPVDLPNGGTYLAFIPGSDTLYVAGSGMSISPDGGDTWEDTGGTMSGATINALAVAKLGNRTVVYIGTPGGEIASDNPSGAGFMAEAASRFEAGVYRLTRVEHYVFLPLVLR